MKPWLLAACAAGALVMPNRAGAADEAARKSGVRIDLDAPGRAAPAERPVPSKTAAPAAAGKAVKATPPAAKKDEKKKQAEPPAKIDGVGVDRGEHGYLGVKIVDGVFRITFYDRERKPKAVDVAGAALRWPVQYQPNDERTFLQPAEDGKSLGSPKIVRPPYRFKLYITLLEDMSPGSGAVPETYVVDFAQ